MSPLVQGQTWVMVNGVLTRRGHNTFEPSGWVYGVTPPDTPGQAGLPIGTVLTTAAVGNITLTDTGPTGPANLTFTGTGTLLDPYLVYRFRTTGVIYNRQTTKYTYFKECDITYNTTSSTDSGIVNSNQSNSPYKADSVVFELCDIHSLRPSITIDGTFGHSMTTIRCHVWNVVDGFGWLVNTGNSNNNAYNKDYGSLIEKLCYVQGCDGNGPANSNPGGVTSPAQQRIDGTHSDGVQIQGGTGHAFFGTMIKATFDGTVTSGITKMIRKNLNYPLLTKDNGYPYYGTLFANSVIQINQNEGTAHPVKNVTFDKVWLCGGHVQKINFSTSNYAEDGVMQFDGCVITNSIFMNDGGSTPGYYDSARAGTPDSSNVTPSWALNLPSLNMINRLTSSGNHTEDGSPVPWYMGSGTVRGHLS